jgi:hypothetical protein
LKAELIALKSNRVINESKIKIEADETVRFMENELKQLKSVSSVAEV